jgi:transketolase
MTDGRLEQLSINTIRTLSIDAVERAKSGHPGTPMALAPLVYTIWNRVLRFDPEDPIWPNRDRFVLSNGHASMLLWSVLHLTGTPAVNARVAVEEASTFGWERYVGSAGRVIGMRTFGASAPLKALQEKCGFEPERVVASAKELLGVRGERMVAS